MDRTRAGIVTALAALVLEGCIGIPLHISSVEQDLPEKAAPIVAGQTDRAQVRQSLGEPLIASDYWRFDAFRISEWNTGVIVFGGGVPVPFWDKEDGYILIAYGDDGRAADVQYGMRSGGAWMDPPGSHESVAVRARDLQLRATGRETFLAVPPDRRDQYLQDVPARDSCRVLVGAVGSLTKATLRVDAQPGPPLPAEMHDTLLLLQLAPGSHGLELVGHRAAVPTVSRFDCAAGALLFAALQVTPDVDDPKHPSIEIVVSSDRPFGFEYQALLIWGNGQWLVPQEPGR